MESLGEMMKETLKTKELDCNIEYCSMCEEPINKIVKIFNREMLVPISCKCKRKELKEKEIEEANREKQLRLERIVKNSLMDAEMKKCTFKNWDSNRGTNKMYSIGKKYFENFKKMKTENIGLLLHGIPGNGKTFTASCVANALINKGTPIICVHIESLLNRIKETYKKWGGEVEEDILRGLANADLLVIDDLGAEQQSDWSKTKIYNILDSRYRNRLPLIITTNKSLKELKEIYHARTYDRLLEMCTPIENTGKSIRIEKAKEKTKILKELLS